MAAYRLSLFLMDLAWRDATALDHGIISSVATQLYRAVTSISANIAEGYGRQSGRDRARFYEYALCSTREALVWYRAASGKLSEEHVRYRIGVLIELRQRIRDVRQGPDGLLYVLTDEDNGALLKIEPAPR